MASKATMKHASGPRKSGAKMEQTERLPQAASEQEVRTRAYEIYLERGAQPGYELEDWLQAQRELAANPSHSSGK